MTTLTASTPTDLIHVLANKDSLEMDLLVQVILLVILALYTHKMDVNRYAVVAVVVVFFISFVSLLEY